MVPGRLRDGSKRVEPEEGSGSGSRAGPKLVFHAYKRYVRGDGMNAATEARTRAYNIWLASSVDEQMVLT